MKQLQYILLSIIVLAVFTSCSSDDDAQNPEVPLSFETLTRDDITALESSMASVMLNGTNDTGILWEDGKILLYRTSDGRLGKLRVLDLSFPSVLLSIEAITYNSDGSMYSSTNRLEIQGNDECDLDAMTTRPTLNQNEFVWERVTELQTRISPLTDFIFVEWEAQN